MPRPMDDDGHTQRHHPPPPPPSSATPPPPPPPPLHHQLHPPPPLPAPFSLSLPLHLTHNPPPQPPYTLSATQPPHPSPNPPDRPSRDDCWSPGATQTLIDAWGARFLDLNRGNLKQKHWKEVADAVNRREGGSKVPKTDVQCKNRLDTLKKKYKMEKSKIVIGGAPSKWSFFDKLDDLTGPCKKQKKLDPLDEPKMDDHKRPAEERDQQPPILGAVNCNRNVATDNNSESKESPDMTDSCPQAFNNAPAAENLKRRRLYESPFKDLERAILRFGEVYERIEIAKQQHMMDLEKRRMEFAKDLEVQRMQLFMQAQLELAKFKHGKHSNTEHYL